MEEVGAQVATPIFLHQSLSGRFYDAPAGMARKKRDLPYQAPSHQQHPAVSQQPRFGNPGVNNSWNPNVWDWDTVRFVAKPLDTEMMTAAPSEPPGPKRKEEASAGVAKSTAVVVDDGDDDERLQLNLGGGLATVEEPAMSSRPNKRVRSGSPGNNGGSYPMCQVDSCKEDLSNAKDYHRRHKVCESHSKSTRALVAKQMQRFCQQCSRFHPLPEFDEGKRSCRRRLAGHNRRRRKTQPEDVTSRLTVPGDANNKSSESLDIVNLLAAIARQQGKNDVRNTNCSPVVDREQILQILSKINSMPLPADLAAKLPSLGSLNWKATDLLSLDLQNKLNGKTSASTMDLITVLSATLAASSSDTLAMLSQKSSQSSDSEKTRLTSSDQAAGPNFQKRSPQEFHSAGGERSSTSYQSPTEDSDCQVQETRVKLPLQLFSSSPEDDSPPKLASSQKYFSSDSSNRTEERSPSSSPPVMQTLFPMKSMAETVKSEKLSTSKEFNMNLDSSRDGGSNLPFDLFGGSNRGAAVSSSIQNFPHQAGYISSGSDHSPSSLNSDPQDRTGRILFKLFDKDPSQLPGTLRQQVYNWLSSSPSQMESYIRPGCVVLSVYVSMSFAAWEQLEENLVQRVSSLVHSSDSDFWRSGRFLVNTGRQLASHKDGKVRLCKAWRTYNSPELISVSPMAVVGGQETSLSIRGRNLTNLGTKIHCTYMGGYSSKEVGTTNRGTVYDEINLGRFQICDASPGVLGRCFIEVENGFKGNSFPVIIADATICRELKLIESEFDAETKIYGATSEDESNDYGRPRSREEVLHFLNELGWLFQRKRHTSMFKGSDYSLGRFKFLLTFTVERDSCILVKTLLDILVNLEGDGLSRESLGMLSDIQLLNRAVKRRCRKMIDLLINYSVTSSDKRYIFPPNLAGPGGLTPLHLAASMSNSDDMVDALTNDPEEIGLNCWTSLLDATGQSPYAYAMMRSNYSYNNLVARKLTDRKNSQVTLTIGSEIEQTHMAMELERRTGVQFRQGSRSCAKCAVAATKYIRRVPGAQGLLQRPFIHSMLAIAAVCVCVCLFLRGAPYIGSVAPFKWENLDFGTI